MEQLLRNAIDLSILGRGDVSIPLLFKLVNSLSQSDYERDSEIWK